MGVLDVLMPWRVRSTMAQTTELAAVNVFREIEIETERADLVMRERVSARVAYREHLQRIRPEKGFTKRGWDPAVQGPLWTDYAIDFASADEQIRQRLQTSRGRSRNLERTNPYARRFFALFLSNVIGEEGLQLKPRVTKSDGTPDELANRRLREEWIAWGQEGNCTLDGSMSWRDVEDLCAVSWQRDGEVLLRLIVNRSVNRWGFVVEPIESDRLDVNLCTTYGENVIRMGIEFDRHTRRIVAYWILNAHPGEVVVSNETRRHTRFPADQIVHLYSRERIGQSRGVPRLEAAMARLHMLGGYEEAELVASRAAASKFGVIQTETGSEYEGDDVEGVDGSGGNESVAFSDFGQGTVEQLGRGQTFSLIDPTHPTNQFGEARKGFLRGAASGTPVNYNSLANDLEGVNYSSLRHATLEERDLWKREQKHFARQVSMRVYRAWLSTALDLGAIQPLLFANFERYLAVQWGGKRWQWIDPLKEAQGNAASIPIFAKTITEIAEERGRTVADIAHEIQSERQIFQAAGIEHPIDRLPDPSSSPSNTPPDPGDG